MSNVKIGQRIAMRRKQLNLTLDDVASGVGVAKSTILRYEKGTIEKIKLPVIEAIARELKVDPAWICCKTDVQNAPQISENLSLPDNIIAIPAVVDIPLIGSIACGKPLLAEENIEGLIERPEHIHADFALRCKGDSMIGARIKDGDIVYIRQQDTVDNGRIAAVLVGEEATLKRVYRQGNTLQLVAENPAYPPLVFVGEEINEVRILGRAVAFVSVIG